MKQKGQDFFSSFHMAIKIRTKQNAATLGLSLGILEALVAVDVRYAHPRGADSVKLPRSKNLVGKASASKSIAIQCYSPFVRLPAE